MARLVDADSLLKHRRTIRVTYHCQGADEWDDYEAVLVKDIKADPTIDPESLRARGKWLKTDAFPHRVYCSNCYKTIVPNDEYAFWCEEIMPRNYCPNCGAKMEDAE